MNENIIPKHPVQKHILTVLSHQQTARFSELRPPRVDTNLFSYHLKLLIHAGFIRKLDKYYALGRNGLIYVDQIGKSASAPYRPSVIAMLIIQNSDGQVLLQKRKKQPYMNTWTVPYGSMLVEDGLIDVAARRIASQKLGLQEPEVRHVGDCYIRVSTGTTSLTTTFVHVFRYEIDKTFSDDSIAWVDPIKLGRYDLAPAVEQVIARSFFGDEYFFAEFEHEWPTN
ncbi:MAG: hypothetical protein JWP06_989 [Candidatus Saccharibacteria bacterium]|nr:hypothetical protein [Candidatus Saccharibacteria bacterium]